jgi:hypothetical protein
LKLSTTKELGHRTKQIVVWWLKIRTKNGMRYQFNTFQFFDILKFSSPCVDERHLAEVTGAFGSVALHTFQAKPYNFL